MAIIHFPIVLANFIQQISQKVCVCWSLFAQANCSIMYPLALVSALTVINDINTC